MKDTEKFLLENLNENEKVVIACSGGPDSMCLLHVLNTLKEKLNLVLICAHVNHSLRKESEEEARFVKEYCENNSIIFEYFIIDGYKNDKFSENEARSKRYVFFDNVIKKYNANILMTAHHGDDLIETILMRMVRGSNLKGYVGIPRISVNNKYKIVRPLLNLTKENILEYLKDNNIDYVVDKSNDSDKYTRNRFRKQLLPFLKKEDINVHLKFLKYSSELENTNKYINRIIGNKKDVVFKNNCIIISEFLKEDEYLQEKILEYIIEEIQKEYIFDISDNQFNNIMKLINTNSNKTINLSNNFIARKSYDKLYIEKINNQKKYLYVFEDSINILNKYKFETIKSTSDKSNNILRINSKEIKLPILIRTREDGDKIKVKNLSGTKKVKDIFIDSKIDSLKRSEYPIVTDSENNVIWIPGLKKSIFDKDINEKYDIIIKYTEENNE